MFDDFFDDNFFNMRSLKNDTFKMDVKDQDTHYLIEAEMPGTKKEEIKLEYLDNHLVIRVEKQEEVNEETENYIHKERRSSSMQRSIYLKDVNLKDIDAKLEDGILKIKIPKSEPDANRIQIEVK
jgi:HSP20 family protein